jgi:agmatine deiminase
MEYQGMRLPASYANFYIANDAVVVPCFDAASDARALDLLAKCFPGRRIAGVPARTLVVGLGGPHCLTQQQPRLAR